MHPTVLLSPCSKGKYPLPQIMQEIGTASTARSVIAQSELDNLEASSSKPKPCSQNFTPWFCVSGAAACSLPQGLQTDEVDASIP